LAVRKASSVRFLSFGALAYPCDLPRVATGSILTKISRTSGPYLCGFNLGPSGEQGVAKFERFVICEGGELA
jgi:hypothetical protein